MLALFLIIGAMVFIMDIAIVCLQYFFRQYSFLLVYFLFHKFNPHVLFVRRFDVVHKFNVVYHNKSIHLSYRVTIGSKNRASLFQIYVI